MTKEHFIGEEHKWSLFRRSARGPSTVSATGDEPHGDVRVSTGVDGVWSDRVRSVRVPRLQGFETENRTVVWSGRSFVPLCTRIHWGPRTPVLITGVVDRGDRTRRRGGCLRTGQRKVEELDFVQ